MKFAGIIDIEDGTVQSLSLSTSQVASAQTGDYARWMADDRIATRKRSLVKALTYRVVIVCLDFCVVYLLTKKVTVAAGFMIISNLYTTVGYFLHERLWARIAWGREPVASPAAPALRA